MFLNDGEHKGKNFLKFSLELNSFLDTLANAIYVDVKANAPKDL